MGRGKKPPPNPPSNGRAVRELNLEPGLKDGQYRDERGVIRAKDPEPFELVSPLASMQFVQQFPASMDRTPAQRAARVMLEKDFKGFVNLLLQLQKEARDEQTNAAPDEQEQAADEDVVDDEGTRRVGALIESLLLDVNRKAEEERQQFVSAGRCTLCGQKPVLGQGEAGRSAAGFCATTALNATR